MAFFGKKSDEDADLAKAVNAPIVDTPAAAPPPAAPVAADTEVGMHEGSRLVVGPNIRLTGSEITDCDTVIVEGRVEATVDGRVMQIAETGMFTGTVAIDMAEIRGQFQGELTVRRRLTVCGTGKVSGKIRYGALVVEEGGELSGDIASLGTAPAAARASSPAAVATPAAKGGESPPTGAGSDEARGKPVQTHPSVIARSKL